MQAVGWLGSARSTQVSAGALAAYPLNAVAPSALDRLLSAGEADVTVSADAAREPVRGITGGAVGDR